MDAFISSFWLKKRLLIEVKGLLIDTLLLWQVFVPLISHCVRPQVSEDRPGGNAGLGLQSARALQSLAECDHPAMNKALSALLTAGGLAVLRRSPEELVRILRTSVQLETPRLVWGPPCRDELEKLLEQVGVMIVSCATSCPAFTRLVYECVENITPVKLVD